MALPTRKMVDDIYEAADFRIAPKTRNISDAKKKSTEYFVKQSREIDERLRDAPKGGLFAGQNKDLIISNRATGKTRNGADSEVIYGWHRLNGKAIQPLSGVHDRSYVDYSHGVRLVSQTARLTAADGTVVTVRMADLLADPDYAHLVSDEGPISRAALSEYGLKPSGFSIDFQLENARIAAEQKRKDTEKSAPLTASEGSGLKPVIVIDSGHRDNSFDRVTSVGGKEVKGFGGTDGEYKANVDQALALGKSFEAKGFEVVYTMHDKHGKNHRNPNTKFDARHAVVHKLLAEGRDVAGYFAVHHDGSTDRSQHGTAVAMHPNNLPQTLQAGIAVADSVAAYAAARGIPVVSYDRSAPTTAVKSTDASAHADWGDHLTWHRSSYIQPVSAGKFIYGQTAGATDYAKVASGGFWDVTNPIPNSVPAMLLEVDFLTNDGGRARAKDPKARAAYAEAVATGFTNYYHSTRHRGNEPVIGEAVTKLPTLDLYSGFVGGDLLTDSMDPDTITGAAGGDMLFAGNARLAAALAAQRIAALGVLVEEEENKRRFGGLDVEEAIKAAHNAGVIYDQGNSAANDNGDGGSQDDARKGEKDVAGELGAKGVTVAEDSTKPPLPLEVASAAKKPLPQNQVI